MVGEASHAQVIGDNIGYLSIQSFDDWEAADLETLLEPVKDTRGLIIDVRLNGGGDPNLAGLIARRLTETAYPCGTEFSKQAPVPMISPQRNYRYSGCRRHHLPQ